MDFWSLFIVIIVVKGIQVHSPNVRIVEHGRRINSEATTRYSIAI
jgi:hypothetical protein